LNERKLTAYRRDLARQLREQAEEVENYVFDRIRALEEKREPEARGSLESLRRLIKPLIEYACVAIEEGEERCTAPPPAVITHARSVAWRPLPTRILQQHYFAAYTTFTRYLRRELGHPNGHPNTALFQVLESTDIVFARLSATVGEEHERALREKGRSSEARRLERIEALLDGEPMEASGLDYNFGATHVGIVGTGNEVGEHIKRVARSLDGRLLLVQASPQRVWAWIGSRRGISASEVEERLPTDCPASARLALGEAASGPAGWARTHREAAEALAVARRTERTVVRYGQVRLLAAILDNPLLKSSLEEDYLAPLANENGRGGDIVTTLRVYFAAECKR
jgi:diguanylate cyclase with GGDEF domain